MFHARRKLPPRPNRDHLVDQADKLYEVMLRTDPTAAPSHAQRKLAQEYGFRGWNRFLWFVRAIQQARELVSRCIERNDLDLLRSKLGRGWIGGFYFAGDAPPAVLRQLLDLGLDPNAGNWQRDTLLHFVIRHQPPPRLGTAVAILLEAGADGSLVNWDDDAPLDELRKRREALVGWDEQAYRELEDRLSACLPMDGDDDWMCDFDPGP